MANSSSWAPHVSGVPLPLSPFTRRCCEWQQFAARWSVLSPHGSNLCKLLLSCCKEDAGTKPAEGAGACGTCCCFPVPSVLLPVHLHSSVLLCTLSSFTPKWQPCVCSLCLYNTRKAFEGEEVSGVNLHALFSDTILYVHKYWKACHSFATTQLYCAWWHRLSRLLMTFPQHLPQPLL